MPTVAKWKKRKITISDKKLMALSGLSTGITLKTDQKQDESGATVSQTVGFEPQPLNFDLTVADVAGVDVRKEWEAWHALVGKTGAFYLNGKKLGPNRFKLTEAALGDILLDNWGRMRMATISLAFTEDAEEGANKARNKSYVRIVQSSALKVAAQAADKAEYVDGLDRRL